MLQTHANVSSRLARVKVMNGCASPQAIQRLPCGCAVPLQVLLEPGVQLCAAQVAELQSEMVPRTAGPQKERLAGEAGSCVHLHEQYIGCISNVPQYE